MNLRPAREEDLPRIVEIYNSTIPTRRSTADLGPVTVEARLSWFRSHRRERPILVCEIGGSVAAWLSFEDFYGRPAYARTAEISLYVAAESRKQGLGSRLLRDALRMAAGLGIRSVVGYVFAHNDPSLRLLASAGFEEWGRLPQVAEMDGREYDLLIMGKRLEGE
jgi:phosphinothricin acetyltransferase